MLQHVSGFHCFWWPTNIPLCVCTAFGFSIYLSMEAWVFHTFLASVSNIAMNIGVWACAQVPTFSFLGILARRRIHILHFHQQHTGFYSLHVAISAPPLFNNHTNRCDVVPQSCFDLPFTSEQWCWAPFMCLLAICVSSGERWYSSPGAIF